MTVQKGSGPATSTAAHDCAALRRCAAGEVDALEDLYRQHAGACLSQARLVLVDAPQAQDAVQEAFLTLWREAARYDGRSCAVRGWLMALTRRYAVDKARAGRRPRTGEAAPCSELDATGADHEAMLARLADAPRRALETLGVSERQAVVLAAVGGYSESDIARLTNVSVGTVRARMLTGMRMLRSVLLPAHDVTVSAACRPTQGSSSATSANHTAVPGSSASTPPR